MRWRDSPRASAKRAERQGHRQEESTGLKTRDYNVGAILSDKIGSFDRLRSGQAYRAPTKAKGGFDEDWNRQSMR
jgi:hypothetical protein